MVFMNITGKSMQLYKEHYQKKIFFRQDTLLVLRCLLLQRKGIKKWNQLLDMQAHLDKRGEGTEMHK